MYLMFQLFQNCLCLILIYLFIFSRISFKPWLVSMSYPMWGSALRFSKMLRLVHFLFIVNIFLSNISCFIIFYMFFFFAEWASRLCRSAWFIRYKESHWDFEKFAGWFTFFLSEFIFHIYSHRSLRKRKKKSGSPVVTSYSINELYLFLFFRRIISSWKQFILRRRLHW